MIYPATDIPLKNKVIPFRNGQFSFSKKYFQDYGDLSKLSRVSSREAGVPALVRAKQAQTIKPN